MCMLMAHRDFQRIKEKPYRGRAGSWVADLYDDKRVKNVGYTRPTPPGNRKCHGRQEEKKTRKKKEERGAANCIRERKKNK